MPWRIPAAWSVVTGGVMALIVVLRPLELDAIPVNAVSQGAAERTAPRGDAFSTHIRETAARSLFRVARRPGATPYDPLKASAPAPQIVARPALRLVGLVDGKEATAVIEGFPGVDGGRVVREGDVVSGLTVQRVASGEVRIAGLDTLWVLRVRTTWR